MSRYYRDDHSMVTGRSGLPRRWPHVIAALLLAGVLLGWLGRSIVAAGTVYSVAQVRDGLAQHPGAWLGRVVRVRGMLLSTLILDRHAHFPRAWLLADRAPREAATTVSYSDGSFTTIYGTNPVDVGSHLVLRVAPGPRDAIRTTLRGLPFGWLLPAPPPIGVRQGTATYPVRLERAPAWLCGVPPCYQGAVQDPDLDSWR